LMVLPFTAIICNITNHARKGGRRSWHKH
jgi:hypothetical protein